MSCHFIAQEMIDGFSRVPYALQAFAVAAGCTALSVVNPQPTELELERSASVCSIDGIADL